MVIDSSSRMFTVIKTNGDYSDRWLIPEAQPQVWNMLIVVFCSKGKTWLHLNNYSSFPPFLPQVWFVQRRHWTERLCLTTGFLSMSLIWALNLWLPGLTSSWRSWTLTIMLQSSLSRCISPPSRRTWTRSSLSSRCQPQMQTLPLTGSSPTRCWSLIAPTLMWIPKQVIKTVWAETLSNAEMQFKCYAYFFLFSFTFYVVLMVWLG